VAGTQANLANQRAENPVRSCSHHPGPGNESSYDQRHAGYMQRPGGGARRRFGQRWRYVRQAACRTHVGAVATTLQRCSIDACFHMSGCTVRAAGQSGRQVKSMLYPPSQTEQTSRARKSSPSPLSPHFTTQYKNTS
jgi:hypothetical protein